MTQQLRDQGRGIRGDLPWQISSDPPLLTKKQDVIPNGATILSEAKDWRNEESQLQASGIF